MIKNPYAFAAKVDQLIAKQGRLEAIEAKLDALLSHHGVTTAAPPEPGPGLVASETPPPPDPAPAPEASSAPDEAEESEEAEEPGPEHDPEKGPRRRHRKHGG